MADVINFPDSNEREMRERFGDLMEFDRRARAGGPPHVRVIRAAAGQLETIPRAEETLPPGHIPPALPVQEVETGAALPETVYLVIRAGVSDEEAAATLSWMARWLRECDAGPPEPTIDPNDDTFPF